MITVENLSKSYGRNKVLTDLSFSVPDATVTGFLGPNGSGKSTTMRCILGLDSPQNGNITFANNRGKIDFTSSPNKATIAGALLDASWFTPGRSARAHLAALAAGAGIPAKRVDECLDVVGLNSVAKKKVKSFSLGMKQRLGIAAALLGDPQHLILDEPVNGLDPEGVRWVRNFAKRCASEGKSVLISSHLLSEMQLTADRLVVIGKGKLIGEYTMEEFLGGGQVIVTVDDPSRLLMALRDEGLRAEPVEQTKQLAIAVPNDTKDEPFREQIGRLCLRENLVISELMSKGIGLEDKFLEATASNQEYRTQDA